MTTDSNVTATTEQIQWKRLSPVASVYYLFKTVKAFIGQALPSLAPLVIVLLNSDDKALIATLAAVGFATLLVVSSLLQYWFFQYQLGDNEIKINQGVFKKQHRVINFDRIQNININQPIYFRPFKLVILVIETAGSKGGEGDLAGIGQPMAEDIRDQILQRQSQIKASQIEAGNDAASTAASTDTESTDEPIATASTGDLIRYGLSNNGMYILLAFMAPFFPKIEEIINYFFSKAELAAMTEALGGNLIGSIIIVVIMIASVFLLMMLISVLGSILKFHNYRLTLTDETLKRKSGLINTQEESLNLSKIQAIARQSNFIGHWLGRENLILRQAGGGGNKQQRRNNLFVVPARIAEQSEQLIETLYPDHPEQIETHPINRRYIFKTLLITLILPVLLISAPFVIQQHFWVMSFYLLPVLCYPLVAKRWRNYRYGKTDEYGLIRSGFIGHKQVLFPLFKVQRAVISQSPVQKRRNLATLTIYLASGKMRIPYMPIEHARQWFDQIYAKIETDSRPWF
ncbi:MAG: PH domain-containing protein [Algicola sp.]|nr:PH domain-containing protein [Algicola sp.]